MSHSKNTKKGFSLFVESWNAKAKNYIVTCKICQKQGYSPSIEDDGFLKTHEHRAIYIELSKIMQPLELDHLGRCEVCARLTDNR